MSQRLGVVLSILDLPMAELGAARLDGEVYALADGWCSLDQADAAATRAVAAGLLVPVRAIAERMTAAWIYGVAPLPSPHQFCVDQGARAHIPPSAQLQLREVTCPPEDMVELAGRRVTTPLRTICDIARTIPAGTADVESVLAALLGYANLTADDVARQPNKALAAGRIRRAELLRATAAKQEDQPSLTR
jgi:hypothetical protein